MTTHGFRALAMTTFKDLSAGTLTFSNELLPARDYLWVGMNMGKVNVIGGFGCTGKTQMVIQLGLEVVLGGIQSREVTQSSGVLIVLVEEVSSEIARSTNAKIQAFKLLEKKLKEPS